MKSLISAFAKLLSMENSSPVTIKNYSSTLNSAERFLSEKYGISLSVEQIRRLDGSMIAALINDFEKKGVSDSSKVQYIRRLNRFFTWASDMGYTTANVSAALPKVRGIGKKAVYGEARTNEDLFEEDEDERVYSDEDIVNMIDIAASNSKPMLAARDCAIIAMLAGTGLRASELASLNIENIRRAKNRCIRVWRKGGKRGTVAIAEFAIPYIEAYLEFRSDAEDDEPLFLSFQGNRLNQVSIWQILSRIQKEAGVKTGVHNFRHTVLTNIAENNTSGVAAMIAGHSSSRITEQYYIHPSTADRVKVMDSLSINDALK